MQESSRNTSTFALLTAKAFDCVDHNKLWKILKEMGIHTTLPASWEIWMQVKKQQLELDMEQQTGSKSGTENIKAVYCHLAFCHKGGVICISEIIDISPGNLDSSLYFFQPSISHDVLSI